MVLGKVRGRGCGLGGWGTVVKTDVHVLGAALNLIKSKSKTNAWGWTRRSVSYLLVDTCSDPIGMEDICFDGDLVRGHGHSVLVLPED